MFREYLPPITAAHHTCVGLGLTLIKQLKALKNASLSGALHLVSCEEAIDNVAAYLQCAPETKTHRVEKEHVMVAARLDIAGRAGLLLLDPGYHVGRVVTVMADGLYPHTGWFTQSDEPDVRREYQYSLSADGKYVLWNVRETRRASAGAAERQVHSCNLVYIDKPYLTGVDVTERRNIVYNFRSLLARTTKGQLTAGVYFPLAVVDEGAGSGPACTIFYTEMGENRKTRIKIPFHLLLDPEAELSVEQELALVMCSRQLGMTDDQLEELLTKVAFIMADESFMTQILAVNKAVCDMSDNN